MEIAMILLAAGYSRRFGSNKLLYQIEGQHMYLRALEQLQKAGRELAEDTTGGACADAGREYGKKDKKADIICRVGVVTQYGEILRTAEEKGVRALLNPHPEEGIASSLRIGLESYKDTDACLFSVADQPWLSSGTIRELIKLLISSQKGMACVSYQGRQGNPCIFSRKYYPRLLELSGDRGGRQILTRYPEDTAFLEISDGREMEDMDHL